MTGEQILRAVRIDALIPMADQLAGKMMMEHLNSGGQKSEVRPGKDGFGYTHFFETEFFHKSIDRLARDAGLR